MSDFVDVGGRLYLVEVAELSSGEPFEVDHAAGAIKISAAVPPSRWLATSALAVSCAFRSLGLLPVPLVGVVG
jgi:hypothetical protein